MFTAPDDLPTGLVADALREHWRVEATDLTYAPLGFGSHHWHVVDATGRRWFATADACAADADSTRLAAALRLAATLRAGGLEFVVAPTPTGTGDVLAPAGGRYALALYPYLAGESGRGAWQDEDERVAMARLLGRLHTAQVPDGAPRFSYALPHRDLVEAATRGACGPWTGGPYGEPARSLLVERRSRIEELLARYDRLVARERAEALRWVVTHGEPHSGNVVSRGPGEMHVIDWDTARVAPRERDLGFVRGTDDPAWAAYRAIAGDVGYRPNAVELFHTWWDLSEIGVYAHWFEQPHGDTTDDRTAWGGLQSSCGP